MLTEDKQISTPEYWDRFYSGKNDAPLDNSNTKRTATYSRFDIVVRHVGPWDMNVLDVGSGHATICKMISARYPAANVTASDQSYEAKKLAMYEPYIICDAYDLPFAPKSQDLVICTQAMEYMEEPDRFIQEAKRVGRKFLCTVPEGEMKKWSQLRIYDEKSLVEWLTKYGYLLTFERHPELLLAKIKFHD